MQEFEDIFGTENGEEAVQEAAVEAVEPVEAPRDDKGRFAPKGEESASPAPQEEPQLEHPALLGERRRRQEAEARIAELEARLVQPPQPAPDLWENTEGWQQHFGTQVVSEAVQQATLNSRLSMSEMMMRQSNPDFDEMKTVFLDLMRENPVLQQQAISDPHPWNKAYQIAKNHKTMSELGATSVDEMRAKIREEIMAEANKTPALPESLAAAGQSRGPTPAAPSLLSFEDVINRR